jgi:FkbM family methyltransferase
MKHAKTRGWLAFLVVLSFAMHMTNVYTSSNDNDKKGIPSHIQSRSDIGKHIDKTMNTEEYVEKYCNFSGLHRTIAEMLYYSHRLHTEIRFLVSLHDPAVDTVVSKGILEGLFGPPGKYPSVDEVHSICEHGHESAFEGSDYNINCGKGGIFVEVGSAIGMVSLYAASRGMKVYAFDPLKPNVERMEESLCVNGAVDCLKQLAQKRIRDIDPCSNGTETWGPFSPSSFRLHENLVGSAADEKGRTVESMPGNLAATMSGGGSYRATVKTVTIDDRVPDPVIDLLLLTSQGHEFEVVSHTL